MYYAVLHLCLCDINATVSSIASDSATEENPSVNVYGLRLSLYRFLGYSGTESAHVATIDAAGDDIIGCYVRHRLSPVVTYCHSSVHTRRKSVTLVLSQATQLKKIRH